MDDYSFIALSTMNFIKQLSEDKIDLKKARYFRTRKHHYCAMNLIKQFLEDKSDLQMARYLQTRKLSVQKKKCSWISFLEINHQKFNKN